MLMAMVGVVALIYTILAAHNRKSPIYRGTAWPAALLGLLQLGWGWYDFRKSGQRQQEAVNALAHSIERFLEKEGDYITVLVSHTEWRLMVVPVIILAAVVITWRYFNKNPFVAGLSLGTAIQLLLVLIIDGLGYLRALDYFEFVQQQFSLA